MDQLQAQAVARRRPWPTCPREAWEPASFEAACCYAQAVEGAVARGASQPRLEATAGQVHESAFDLYDNSMFLFVYIKKQENKDHELKEKKGHSYSPCR